MSSSPRKGGVLVVAEQLRRAVPGGIGTYVEGLLTGLAGLAPTPIGPFAVLASAAPSPDPLLAFGLPVETMPLPSRLLVKAWDLGFARVGRDDALVHTTSFAIPPSSAPIVATVHDLAFRALPNAYPGRGRRWHEAALGRAVRRAAHFVVPSQAVADDLRAEISPTARDRVTVIEEGADLLPPPDRDGAERLLAELGVHGPFLLTVGTLEPRKNLARLVEAYRLARPRLAEPWPLIVVGPSGWGDELDLAGTEGVILAGRVSPGVLAQLYRGCRCLAYVPLLEGFGLPVVEAMRFGAPVVASAVPSSAGAALEVDPTDPEAIGDALLIASGETGRRAALIAAGAARAAPLTWAATAAAHVEVWHQVLER